MLVNFLFDFLLAMAEVIIFLLTNLMDRPNNLSKKAIPDGLCIYDFPARHPELDGKMVTEIKNLTIEYCKEICQGTNLESIISFEDNEVFYSKSKKVLEKFP